MEHVGAGDMDCWYANRDLPPPASLRRLAVIAPDDAPGLAALRQRLAQRTSHPLRCDHYAAGFNAAGSGTLAQAFEQMRLRHAAEPYDVVLLLDGSPDALGIAESNGVIPAEVSRTPAPVWTAIGEDDANTELGDVANRVFASAGALIDALPLAGKPQPSTPREAPGRATAARHPASSSSSSLSASAAVRLTAETVTPRAVQLPVLSASVAGTAQEPARTHPLVLCAAFAVILASLTAIAAMLGWLPSQKQLAAQPATPAGTVLTTAPPAATSAASASSAGSAIAAPPPAAPVQAIPDQTPASAAVPAQALPSQAPTPAAAPPAPAPEPAAPASAPGGSGSDSAPLAAAAALGAAGLVAAAPRKSEAAPSGTRQKRPARRPARPEQKQAQGPRQVGSEEVPVVEFVGTKTREQVIAEMMQARRAANRQAANGNMFPRRDRQSLPN